VTYRLVTAEFLKLVKRKGVVIAAVILTLVMVIIVMAVPQLYHLRHSATTATTGGYRGMYRGSIVLGFLGSVAGLIVGSAAGTGDLSSGIFRVLVATGRSRWALFAARVPGSLALFVPIVTVAFAVMIGFDEWFSSGTASIVCGGPSQQFCVTVGSGAPPASEFVHWYLWVLLITCFDLLVSLGLSSWVSSRSLTIGLLLGFQLIVAPLLSQVTQLGGAREALFTQSFTRLAPPRGSLQGVRMFGLPVTSSVAMAWFVLAVWVVVLVGAGAWRTATRDA